MPRSEHCLVEALGQQAVDDFLANLAGKTAANHRLRHFAGAEAGNLGIFAVLAGHAGVGLGDLVSGDIEHQLAGAFRIKNRAVAVRPRDRGRDLRGRGLMIVIVGRRFRLRVVFESVRRTQRFAFQARPVSRSNLPHWRFRGCTIFVSPCMPSRYNLRPPHWAAACRGISSVWPGNLSSHGKRVCWKGQTARRALWILKDRERYVTAQ